MSFFHFFKGISKQDGVLFLQKKMLCHTARPFLCVFATTWWANGRVLPANGGLLLPFACGTFGQGKQRCVEHKTTHPCWGKCTFEGLLAQNATLVQQFAFALACGASGKTFCVCIWLFFVNCNAMGVGKRWCATANRW